MTIGRGVALSWWWGRMAACTNSNLYTAEFESPKAGYKLSLYVYCTSQLLMLLKYVPSLIMKTGIVSSLDFSLCGRILAIVSLEGEISLWDTSTGNRYHPTLTLGCRGRSALLWVDNKCFVFGLSDGSIGTCEILEGISTSPKRLVRGWSIRWSTIKCPNNVLIAG